MLNLECIQKLQKFILIYQILFIFKQHNFTYFLYGLFDTQNFGQEIKGRFFLNLQKKQEKKRPFITYIEVLHNINGI